MRFIKAIAQKEPALAGTVLTFIAAPVAALLGKPDFAPVLVAVGLLLLGVRSQVTPVKKAEEQAVKAAEMAATNTAENLNSSTAGHLGEITDQAQSVITDAVGLVKGLLK